MNSQRWNAGIGAVLMAPEDEEDGEEEEVEDEALPAEARSRGEEAEEEEEEESHALPITNFCIVHGCAVRFQSDFADLA